MQRVSGRISPRRNTPRHIAIKMTNIKDKDKILKVTGKSKMVDGRYCERHQRAHTNHNHRKLANLITPTTALSNSMKLRHAVWGHPRQTGHGGEV